MPLDQYHVCAEATCFATTYFRSKWAIIIYLKRTVFLWTIHNFSFSHSCTANVMNKQLLTLAFFEKKNPLSYMTFTFNTKVFLLTPNTKVADEYIFTESQIRPQENWHCPSRRRNLSLNCSFLLFWGQARQFFWILVPTFVMIFRNSLKINHFTSSDHDTFDRSNTTHWKHNIGKYEEMNTTFVFLGHHPKQKKNTNKENSVNYKNPQMACLTSDKR